MAVQRIFNIEAVQSWIKRYVDTLVYGKYNQTINNVATNRPIFFAKMRRNSTAIFNIRVSGPTMNGTICMAVSVGEINDLSRASMSILSTSIPVFFNSSSIYLATQIDGVASDFIFAGFSAAATGLFTISIQAVSSERRGVAGVVHSPPMINIPHIAFPVSDGYLAGYPVIKPIRELDAFRRWNANFQYEAEDPVFFAGSAFFANPVAVPNIGESPVTHPGKWIQLARPEGGEFDLTEGARTPQLFYNPGLIISNTTALRLRKAWQDQGMEYPSQNSRVYHFDGDLFDQNQQNPLTVIPFDTEFYWNDAAASAFPYNLVLGNDVSFNQPDPGRITPHFISENSIPEPPITPDPAIPRKPFKEMPESFYGTFIVPITMAVRDGNNCLAFWFKLAEIKGLRIFEITLAAGEKFIFVIGAEEPFWNDNTGVPAPDNFPYNSNVLLPGTVLFNNRKEFTNMVCLQSYDGHGTMVPVNIPNAAMPQPNRWNHIAFNLDVNSITVFLNGNRQTFPRMSSGLDGDAGIVINPDFSAIVLDEMIMDWTAGMSFDRFLEVSMTRLPWAAHEWKDGWLTIYADDPNKINSNLALHLFPPGSVIPQASFSGVYLDEHLPWNRFHNFTEDQFILQGEIAPSGGNGETTRFWQRIS